MSETELQPRQIRHYGWRPSLPDPRELLVDVADLTALPEVDPRKDLPPVFDQGQLGSCTANATAALFEYDAVLNGHDPGGRLSRLWIYYFERKLEGTLGQGDTGAMGHDAFRVAAHLGVPLERDWPYDISTFEQAPPEAAVKDALGTYQLKGKWKSVPQNQLAIKQVLSNRQTVAIGFTVFESFESAELASSGIMPVPNAQTEQVLGGHEVLVVGYLKDHPDHALVRNSWGEGWGIGGYFLFPWSVLLDSSLTSDLRTIPRPAGK